MIEFSRIKVGEMLPMIETEPINGNLLQEYAEFSGDQNRIHLDEQVAEQAGFRQPIAHGMLTMALTSRIISPWLSGRVSVAEYETRFFHPLYAGDRLYVHGRVINKVYHRATATISVIGNNQHDQTMIKGKAHLRFHD